MALLTVVLVGVVALITTMWILVGHEQQPGAIEVAVAYELARDRNDWSTMFDLSGVELRGELDRSRFVASRSGESSTDVRRASDAHVAIERSTVSSDSAVVFTRVEALDGMRRNVLQCERRQGRWWVIGHEPVVA